MNVLGLLSEGESFTSMGVPVQLADSYYPADLAEGTELAEPRKLRGYTFAALQRLGVELDHFKDELHTRMPTPSEVRSLRLGKGTPHCPRDPDDVRLRNPSAPSEVTMNVFNDSLDLRSALAEAADRGTAFVPDALAEPFRRELQDEINTMPLEPMPAEEGVARQEGEMLMISGTASPYPAVEQLRTALNAQVSAHGDNVNGLGEWRPNHISVQRYPAGALGITPHLDHKRYHYLVAVFTAEGRAPFTWCKDRAGTPEAVWQAGPGSLVLLRGPGLAGVDDGRPLHMVAGPPVGQRVSVTFRMDSRAL